MLVYVHGNCQARAIAQMLAPVFPQWQVPFYEVFQQNIIDEIENYHSLVASADIIIAQPINAGYRDRDDLSLDWVQSHAKRGTPVVTFPSMYFGGQLTGWTSLAIPGYGMPYVDPVLIKMVLAGLTVEQITDVLLAPDLYDDAFIGQEIEASIAEIRRRESADGTDVRFSPFLEEYGRSTQIFHVINHPCRPALAYMANEILTHIGYDRAVPEVGEDHIKYPHVPCAPAVIRFFARSTRAIHTRSYDDRFHFPNENLSRRQYIHRSVTHFRSRSRTDLEICVGDSRAKPFLDRATEASSILRKALSSASAAPSSPVVWRAWDDVRLQDRTNVDFFDTPFHHDQIEVLGRGAVSPLAVDDHPMWRPIP